jgi:hypothetical protein
MSCNFIKNYTPMKNLSIITSLVTALFSLSLGVNAQEKSPELAWKKYDFVPGEIIIFEDNQEN